MCSPWRVITTLMAPFSFPTNHQVVFLFTSKTSFKHKQELRDLLVKHGATVSYIVTRKTSLVIAESADVITDNYKIKQALKLGIPIVSLNFLDDCIQRQKYLDPSMYLLAAPVKKDEKFDNGQIKAPPRQKKTFSAKTYLLRPDNLPVYQLQDNNCPSFDEPRLIKAALFQKQDDDIHPSYQVLELQNSRDENRRYKYRVSTQLAQSSKYGTLKVAPMMYRFTEDADSALLVYSSLYMKYSNTGYSEVWQVPAGVISQLGSKLFHEWFQQNMYSSSVDDEVAQVVETMWLEAVGSVEEKISIPVSHLKLSEVEKAETDLRRLQEAMKKKMVKSEIEPLKEEYYQHLPHKEEYKMELNTVRDICVEKDMCQVIKDVIAISESTDWSTKVSSLSRFNALHCHIQTLPKCDSSFRELTYLIHGDDRGLKKVKIHNIFKVCRFTEEKQFQDLGNKQLLFHGSKIQNYVGLLSRGLLLPQTIVEDYGVERSDVGNLGFGVYFSDSAQASLKYTTRSNIKGSTFLLVSEVALGDVHHTKTRMLDLKAPPGGFNSVHGVKSSATEKTDFKDDEYAVYDIHQQRIRYLIELSLPEEELHQVPVTLTDSESDETEQEETEKDTDIEVYTHLKRPSMCYYRDPPDLILLIQWIQYQRRDLQTSKNNIFINEALFPVRNNFI
ncbi:hypothetical protein LSH36_377g03033 [Paralvinella palmiformis]|uniref:Poly [ADP-ribose] polymerase n=1 Tax=Paralvinella palmiformis TaxID=53620 RepID=A0AAD9N105_9ANNE|nr:hypothetical protein LSH36_377g03033 [Paralvinella palmiformis]